MVLNIAAAYWPDADEVVVTFDSTEDDGTTVTVADSLSLDLLIETRDLIGTASYRPLSKVVCTSEYLRPDKTYHVRFRSPQRKMDLFLDVKAQYGSDPEITKRVRVGLSDSPRFQMDLPGNDIWELDVLNQIVDLGSDDDINNDTKVVLSPILRNYVKDFIFSENKPAEEFADLTYLGGGVDRLFMNSQTNSYVAQQLRAPWDIPAYCFLEPAAENLFPNSYFTMGTTDIPAGWDVDAAGTVVTYQTLFDYQTSDAAKIWTSRFRQQNAFGGFNTVRFTTPEIPITDIETYCFSSYLRMRRMNPSTVVSNVRLTLQWLDASGLVLSFQQQIISTETIQRLTLLSITDEAPPGTDRAKIFIDFYSVDSGDDIEVSIFAPQMEKGPLPTGRLQTSRDQDRIETLPYDPKNQKIRLQMIAGFPSTLSGQRDLITGPLAVYFAAGQLVADLGGVYQLSVPCSFVTGDFLDLTVSHQENGKMQIYRDGVLLDELNIGTVSDSPAPLFINGIGVELLKLSIFGRV